MEEVDGSTVAATGTTPVLRRRRTLAGGSSSRRPKSAPVDAAAATVDSASSTVTSADEATAAAPAAPRSTAADATLRPRPRQLRHFTADRAQTTVSAPPPQGAVAAIPACLVTQLSPLTVSDQDLAGPDSVLIVEVFN